MTEQKLINARVDPQNAERAMAQIRSAAGDPSWRIVNIVWLGDSVDTARISPGNNDPARLEGSPVLVVLERRVRKTDDETYRLAESFAA